MLGKVTTDMVGIFECRSSMRCYQGIETGDRIGEVRTRPTAWMKESANPGRDKAMIQIRILLQLVGSEGQCCAV